MNDDGLQLFRRDAKEEPPLTSPKWVFSQEPMCKECLNHCRDFGRETEGGKWPVPLHSPGCRHYKKEKFFAVGLYGHYCIMTESEKDEHLRDEDEDGKEDWDIREVWLCKDQVESLTEFEGW